MSKLISKKTIPRLLIGLILLILLIVPIISVLDNLRDLKLHHDIEINFLKIIKYLFYSNYFIRPILLIVSIYGFFQLNKFGWLSISILFYYTLFVIVFITVPSTYNDWYDFIFLLIPFSFIVILNLKSIRVKYKIKTKVTLTLNMIAIIIGLGLTYLKGYIHLYHDLSIWEVIDKIQ